MAGMWSLTASPSQSQDEKGNGVRGEEVYSRIDQFKVVRVDVSSGIIEDFAVNEGSMNGLASRIGGGGLERPVAARFDPSGIALYIVDFGVMTI
jgi:hypothetical protein